MALNLSSLTPQEQIATLFIAYFDRAPAPSGLDYWVGKLTSGEMTIGEIATSFGKQLETIGLYPELGAPNAATPESNLALVTDVFQNLFGRDPANGADNYYVQQLNAGADIGKIIVQIANGAVGADKELLENKIEVGLDWASDALIANIATTTNPLSAVVDGELVILDQEAYDNARSVLDGVTADDATVDAAKAATDAFIDGYGEVDPVDPVAETYVLTDDTDVINAGGGNDEFIGNQDTTNTSDRLDGGDGDDTLTTSVANGTGDFFEAPTLSNIETIEVNGPNLEPDQDITMDLSNATGYETLRSFQTTSDDLPSTPMAFSLYSGPMPTVSFRDIQNVNGTDIEIIDTNADHLFTYDSNAFETLFGNVLDPNYDPEAPEANDDQADIKLQEVNGSTIDLMLENPVPGTPGGDMRSHIDVVNITSLSRAQVNTTTNNYVYDLNVGPVFTDLNVTGDADLEIERFLEGPTPFGQTQIGGVNTVDATTLDGDLTLDLYGQGVQVPLPGAGFGQTPFNITGGGNPTNPTGLLTVMGSMGDNDIDVSGDTNGLFMFQGGNDTLRVGSASDMDYVRQDVFGNTVVMTGDEDEGTPSNGDTVILNITGIQDVNLGAGHDELTINGNVDDLSTRPFNDGVSDIDAGTGDDKVTLNGIAVFETSVEDLDNDYLVDLGDGDDTLEANGGGDVTVSGGAGEDNIAIEGNGDQVIDSGDDNDTVSIEGDGVHDILLGGGDDDLSIIGSRLPDNNIDNAVEDRQTTIDGGDGNDTILVDGDHYLLASLGLGMDSIELNTDELTVDDIIYGNRAGEEDTEIDTLILNNDSGNVFTGSVGRSETSSVSGIDVFDLRDTNITLLLSSDNFDTAVDRDILVKTTEANSLTLPVLFDGTGPQVEQGMSRADYEAVANFYFGGDGVSTDEAVEFLNAELFFLTNGLQSINFFDGDASGDGQTITALLEPYGGNTVGFPASADSVDFQGAPDGEMVVDITNIPMSVVSGRNFELQGGNIKDVIIADDAVISSRLVLDYDYSKSTLHSIEDTLQVIDGAHISAADLRNTNGLEIIELLSADNDAQAWTVELTDRVINQTTSNANLIIRVDPEVPAGSTVVVEVDPSVYTATATKNVVIETVSNAQIFIDMKDGNGPQLVTQPDFGVTDYNPGPLGSIIVMPRLLFTENGDNLEGTSADDIFTATSLDQIQSGDVANGFAGQDTLLLHNVTVSNQFRDLWDQLENVGLTSIEAIEFDTGLNVQMTGLDDGNGPLQNGLNTVTTGSGNDDLRDMEAIGSNLSEGYFLGGGDDTFTGFGDTLIGTGNGTTDEDYYVDGGLGDDEVTMRDEDNLFGTDIETINLETDADADLRTVQGVDGNEMVVNGTADSTDNNVDLNSSIRKASDGTLATVILNDIEDLDDLGGDNIMVMDNERGGPDGDSDVTLNAGDDSLTATNMDDLTVTAGAGTKTVNVGGGALSNVNNFTYTGGTGTGVTAPDGTNNFGGVDNIVAVIDDDADIDTGDLDDSINVTSTQAGTVTVNAGDGDDTVVARSIGGTVSVNGGDGADGITVTTQAGETSTIDTGLGGDGVGDTVDLYTPTIGTDPAGGEDTIVFGNIVYDTTQNVVTGDTTQNFLQQGLVSPIADVEGVTDSIDTINNFNIEGGGPGSEDVFDFNAFITDDEGGVSTDDDFVYADWTGGVTNVDAYDFDFGGFVLDEYAEVAVIRVNNGFELDASHIVEASVGGSPLGIEVEDNGARIVVTAYDTDNDGSLDTADLYAVQDVDQDGGQAWAVDKVATVTFATEIGAITSIESDNFDF